MNGKQIYSPDNVFFFCNFSQAVFNLPRPGRADRVAVLRQIEAVREKCQTHKVASTEHLLENISARWKRVVAQKARNCNVSNIMGRLHRARSSGIYADCLCAFDDRPVLERAPD